MRGSCIISTGRGFFFSSPAGSVSARLPAGKTIAGNNAA
jgi:hypothetical protein